MKEILKKVYYCEFCKKKGLSKGHMIRHESSCTMNINRICRFCGILESKNDLPELINKWKEEKPIKSNYDQVLSIPANIYDGKKLMEDVCGCPVCALSIIRQLKLDMFPNQVSDFDFKKLMSSLWDDINEEKCQYEY
ncbi:MAG: hypothetical protein JNN05_10605 [Candidatus Omnitrophica bacterium]|nr:hypothetical protein [Candidatus Omnitrophota bacterium]